jgi:DNA-binding MarR family transcriptional regulator
VIRRPLKDEDYRHLLTLRHGLRRFLRWSEEQAERAGLTPAQHQLLLAIRGQARPLAPTIGSVAESLLLRHHSVVELVDRAEEAGLVRRSRDPADRRVVRLSLTPLGRRRLETLSVGHLEELARLSRWLLPVLEDLEPHGSSTPSGAIASR